MTFTVRAFGLDIFSITATTDGPESPSRIDDLGSTPIGFTSSAPVQRWEPGADLG